MDKVYANGLLSKSGLENPSKSDVIGRCGGCEKNEWPRGTDTSRTLKKQTKKNNKKLMVCLRVCLFEESHALLVQETVSRS